HILFKEGGGQYPIFGTVTTCHYQNFIIKLLQAQKCRIGLPLTSVKSRNSVGWLYFRHLRNALLMRIITELRGITKYGEVIIQPMIGQVGRCLLSVNRSSRREVLLGNVPRKTAHMR